MSSLREVALYASKILTRSRFATRLKEGAAKQKKCMGHGTARALDKSPSGSGTLFIRSTPYFPFN